MPALIYCRVSTEKQQDEGTSLLSQEERCREFAAQHGYAVKTVVRESHTGAEFWERPKLNAERDRIKAGEYDAVICYAVDRLSRDIAHLSIFVEECERADVKLLFVTEDFDNTPEGKLIRSVRGYVAEIERQKIRERVTRGKRMRVDLGRMINASTPLYGYHQDKKTSARSIKPEESRIVRRIWDEAFAGHGTIAIAQKLNRDGVPSPAIGKREFKDGRTPTWCKTAILRILREPGYAGLSVGLRWVRWKVKGKYKLKEQPRENWKILSDDLTPAIVTPEEFDRMQALISSRRCGDAARNELRFALLRGLAFCAKCGRKRNPDQDGYRCSSRYTGQGRCGSPASPNKALEEWAWGKLVALLNDAIRLEASLQANPNEAPDHAKTQQRAAELDATVTKLASQQERLLTGLADAEGDLAGMVAAKIKKLDQERRAAKMELERLRRQLGAKDSAREDLIQTARLFREQLAVDNLSSDQKYRLFKLFEVRVFADGREGWRFELGVAASGNPL